jgi:hypothetical protein
MATHSDEPSISTGFMTTEVYIVKIKHKIGSSLKALWYFSYKSGLGNGLENTTHFG